VLPFWQDHLNRNKPEAAADDETAQNSQEPLDRKLVIYRSRSIYLG
jgi:hypothetical protein